MDAAKQIQLGIDAAEIGLLADAAQHLRSATDLIAAEGRDPEEDHGVQFLAGLIILGQLAGVLEENEEIADQALEKLESRADFPQFD